MSNLFLNLLKGFKMDVNSKENNELSIKRIKLQGEFNDYKEKNGFSYQEWLNPPSGHFYESYKKEMDTINNKMAPPLSYQ
jgi:hypothetical protein